MKIGILTYHRAENYGALLQAYALKEYLYTKGYDVAFVDIILNIINCFHGRSFALEVINIKYVLYMCFCYGEASSS